MTRQVITFNAIEGFHRYPDAPSFCNYLAARHRHIFNVVCCWNVSHNDREIEINHTQNVIAKDIADTFGTPAEFGDMSCEDICEYLLNLYPQVDTVEVTEDGYGGATLTR